MENEPELILGLAEALGIGLLIGIERERNAQASGEPATAGVRSFTLAALAGAVSQLAGGTLVLAVTVVAVGAMRVVVHYTQRDRTTGITTSLALLIVVLLGALSLSTAFVAAAVAVVVASLLAARAALHDFSRSTLTSAELRDGLILSVAVLVILPVLPNIAYGPGGALNPRNLFIIVVLVMAIGAAGHICTRVFGARLGLPLSGFLSGFVSSTATIAAMARRAQDMPGSVHGATSGATLSSVSSLIQIGIILVTLSQAFFAAAMPVLAPAAIVAGLYGAAFMLLAIRRAEEPKGIELPSRIFSVTGAIYFALTVAGVMLVSAMLNDWLGSDAVLIAAALAGLVSTNSAAVALASLVGAGQLAPNDAVIPLTAAITTNTALRIGISLRSGAAGFGRSVAAGLALTGLVLWTGWLLGEMIRGRLTL